VSLTDLGWGETLLGQLVDLLLDVLRGELEPLVELERYRLGGLAAVVICEGPNRQLGALTLAARACASWRILRGFGPVQAGVPVQAEAVFTCEDVWPHLFF
jgi:hypothetical protein